MKIKPDPDFIPKNSGIKLIKRFGMGINETNRSNIINYINKKINSNNSNNYNNYISNRINKFSLY